jgi:hypothetical protein
VAEGFVRLRHLVGLFSTLHCGAKIVGCIHEFSGKLVNHALSSTFACRLDEPAHTEAEAALAANLNWHLIRCATNTAGLHFDQWSCIPKRKVKNLKARLVRLRLNALKRLAQDTLGQAALAA